MVFQKLIDMIFRCILFTIFITGYASGLFAYTANSLKETDLKLKHLDKQIKLLNKNMDQSVNRKDMVHLKLEVTDRTINDLLLKLIKLKKDIQINTERSNELAEKIQFLNNKYNTQQQLISQHIRKAYQIGEYQPLKWLLNDPNDIKSIGHAMVYYQYLLKARKSALSDIIVLKNSIKESNLALQAEIFKKNQLSKQLEIHQTQLLKNKKDQTDLIQNLHRDIKGKQKQLTELTENKDQLTKLFKKLEEQTRIISNKPFSQMKKKLSLPIKVSAENRKNINQGITFIAPEGTTVDAIYSGKVIFSDWLRGYGLLIIIDHG